MNGHPTGQTPSSQLEATGALIAAAASSRLLVAVDFDGVIAPIVPDPSAVVARPETVASLLRLAAMPDTMVAVVSGRDCRSLEQFLVNTDDFVLIGSHGAETKGVPLELSAAERQTLAELTEALDALVDHHSGFHVEVKTLSAAAHSRRVEGDRTSLHAALQQLADEWDGKVVSGKEVVEFTLRHATKGDAVRRLAETHAATVTVYVGDDVTDEDAFAVLRPDDVGIKVGEGRTAANYRVKDPIEVSEVLAALSAARSNAPR